MTRGNGDCCQYESERCRSDLGSDRGGVGVVGRTGTIVVLFQDVLVDEGRG